MTLQEWLDCNDIDRMLKSADDFCTESQLRLFACACCRRIWLLMSDERSRKAVELAEQYAVGRVDADTILKANKAAGKAWIQHSQHHDDHAAAAAFYCSTSKPALLPAAANRTQAAVPNKLLEREQQADLLRDIVGRSAPSTWAQSPGI